MARVSGAGGSRRTIRGLHDALLAHWRAFDAHWHVPDDCGPCRRVAALEDGEPMTFPGKSLWKALFDERRPGMFDELMHDETLYEVRGDVIAVVAA